VTTLLLNVLLGLVPAFALAWSIAADERRPSRDRVVATESDRRGHNLVFSLVYGLWGLTMGMWNWMRSEHPAWIVFWVFLGTGGLVAWLLLIRRKRRSAHAGAETRTAPPSRISGS
jgi:hypothetical protein